MSMLSSPSSTRAPSPAHKPPKAADDLADSLPVLSYGEATPAPADLSFRNQLRGARWRSDDYFLGFIAGFCLLTDLGVYTLYSAIVPFRLKAIGLDNEVSSVTGYISAAAAAGALVASPLAGWLGQAFPHKRALLLANLALLAGGVLCFMLVPSVIGMILARVMQGAAAAGLWTAALALISDNVDPARAGKVTALSMLGHSIGNTSSQTIGGSLYQSFGWKAPNVYGLALIGICALLCLLFVEKTVSLEGPTAVNSARASVDDLEKQPDTEDTTIAKARCHTQLYSTRKALRALLTRPAYFVGLLFSAWYGGYQGAVTQTILPLHLEDRYGLDASQVGYSYLAIAAPAFVSIPLIGFLIDKWGPRRLSLGAAGTLTIWLAVMCIHALPYPAFMAVLGGVGISVSLVNTPIVVYLAAVDREEGGLVGTSVIYGCWNMAYSLSQLVFPIMAGNILDRVGNYRGWMIVLSMMSGLGAACLLAMLRWMRLKGPVSPEHTTPAH